MEHFPLSSTQDSCPGVFFFFFLLHQMESETCGRVFGFLYSILKAKLSFSLYLVHLAGHWGEQKYGIRQADGRRGVVLNTPSLKAHQ